MKILAKSFSFILLLFSLLYSQEAFVSQVHLQNSGETLEQLTKVSAHILEVVDLDKSEVFNEVHFSKETHFNKEKETIYKEIARYYKVVAVLKSNRITQESIVKIWQKPAYDEFLVRNYHEQGISKSVLQEEYFPKYKLSDPKHLIVFLKEHGTKSDIYILQGSEGQKAKKEIKKIISK
jgi:hypothetical protein